MATVPTNQPREMVVRPHVWISPDDVGSDASYASANSLKTSAEPSHMAAPTAEMTARRLGCFSPMKRQPMKTPGPERPMLSSAEYHIMSESSCAATASSTNPSHARHAPVPKHARGPSRSPSSP